MITIRLTLPVILVALIAGELWGQTDELEAQGKAVFEDHCVHCHGTAYGERSVTDILEERYGGSPPGALEERTNMTGAYIEEFVRGNVGMAPFRPTEVSDADLEALIAYLTRNN